MRPTHTFTDHRIHVTLLDGAFDLHRLGAEDRMVWTRLVSSFRQGLSLAEFEALLGDDPSADLVTCRLHLCETLLTLWGDMCRRVALDERLGSAAADQLQPWRSKEARRWFQREVGYVFPTPQRLRSAA